MIHFLVFFHIACKRKRLVYLKCAKWKSERHVLLYAMHNWHLQFDVKFFPLMRQTHQLKEINWFYGSRLWSMKWVHLKDCTWRMEKHTIKPQFGHLQVYQFRHARVGPHTLYPENTPSECQTWGRHYAARTCGKCTRKYSFVVCTEFQRILNLFQIAPANSESVTLPSELGLSNFRLPFNAHYQVRNWQSQFSELNFQIQEIECHIGSAISQKTKHFWTTTQNCWVLLLHLETQILHLLEF